MSEKGLGEAVYQKPCADSDREGEPAPPELLFQRNYENAETVSCACADQGNEHRRGYDVPPIIYSRLRVSSFVQFGLTVLSARIYLTDSQVN